MAENTEEDFLSDIFAFGVRYAEETDDAKHPGLMSCDERFERPDVASACGLDDYVVLRVVVGQNELLFPRTSTAMTE